MDNFYSKLSSKYKNKSYNPNKGKTHNFDLPFRLCIVGCSGSGKSNCLLNLLKKTNGTFSHIYLCLKNRNEPLYNMLCDKLGDDITVFENGEVPPLSSIEPNEEQLIIFDDLVGDKKATIEIIEYFKMARKVNLSCCYLSQAYFKIDLFLRQNTNYLIIKKVASKRDLKLILSDFTLNCDIKELQNIYSNITKKFEDVMTIDLLNGHIFHNFMNRIL